MKDKAKRIYLTPEQKLLSAIFGKRADNPREGECSWCETGKAEFSCEGIPLCKVCAAEFYDIPSGMPVE